MGIVVSTMQALNDRSREFDPVADYTVPNRDVKST